MTYRDIGGGYRFAKLRVGCALMAPDGREVYFQPGNDTAMALETVAALDEVSPDVSDHKRGIIADMTFGDYFAT